MVPRGSLGFPVVFPLQAPCLPTASVKQGVSAGGSKGQQARCVLRSVLRLTNGLSEAPAAPLCCAGHSSLTRPSWTSCTFSCERPKAPLWITIGSSGDHPQRGEDGLTCSGMSAEIFVVKIGGSRQNMDTFPSRSKSSLPDLLS